MGSLLNVLVYGFYDKGNIGDELFKETFISLFPDFNFTFTDILTKDLVNNNDCVFFGGGSFLEFDPKIEDLSILETKKIFYIGVGGETKISKIHEYLIKKSELIAFRNENTIKNSMIIPDLVFSLNSKIKISNKLNKTILFIPNYNIVPKNIDSHWKHTIWETFKCEAAQFLDTLIEQKYNIVFYPFCKNDFMDDTWAAIEIINKMKYAHKKLINNDYYNSIENLSHFMSQFSFIISQRYHGIVLAEMLKIPYISIYHHDKLKLKDNSISIYESHKNNLLKLFFESYYNPAFNYQVIEQDNFEELKSRVYNAAVRRNKK